MIFMKPIIIMYMLYFGQVTIIDYTLSRITHNHESVYNDLTNDNELFNSDGDYQFEIYRKMKEETK